MRTLWLLSPTIRNAAWSHFSHTVCVVATHASHLPPLLLHKVTFLPSCSTKSPWAAQVLLHKRLSVSQSDKTQGWFAPQSWWSCIRAKNDYVNENTFDVKQLATLCNSTSLAVSTGHHVSFVVQCLEIEGRVADLVTRQGSSFFSSTFDPHMLWAARWRCGDCQFSWSVPFCRLL